MSGAHPEGGQNPGRLPGMVKGGPLKDWPRGRYGSRYWGGGLRDAAGDVNAGEEFPVFCNY